MTLPPDHRGEVHASLHPLQRERLVDGSSLHLVTLVLDDGPDTDQEVPAVVATLRPREARTLAAKLLDLADDAERSTRTGGR